MMPQFRVTVGGTEASGPFSIGVTLHVLEESRNPTFPMGDRQVAGKMENLSQMARHLGAGHACRLLTQDHLPPPSPPCTAWLTWEDLIPVHADVAVLPARECSCQKPSTCMSSCRDACPGPSETAGP